jgi:TDG/mug DNA glycosylase family protein
MPRILFVGINPSLASARVGHHFAGPGNPFYRLLHAAGFVPEPLTFVDDVRLPDFGLGLTNIAERATREASELTPLDYAKGRKRLARMIAEVRPAVVAFVGGTAYRQFFGPSASPGPGAKPERIEDAAVFVVPNPSGRNAAYPGFQDKLTWYRQLKRWSDLPVPLDQRVERADDSITARPVERAMIARDRHSNRQLDRRALSGRAGRGPTAFAESADQAALEVAAQPTPRPTATAGTRRRRRARIVRSDRRLPAGLETRARRRPSAGSSLLAPSSWAALSSWAAPSSRAALSSGAAPSSWAARNTRAEPRSTPAVRRTRAQARRRAAAG